jgi:para-aminobenzoate synthetase component 1
MNELSELSGKITGINCRKIDIDDSFLDIASRFASKQGTVVLMSGGDLDSSKYHILGVRPWLSFSAKGEKISIALSGKELTFQGNPFDTLQTIIDSCRVKDFSLPLPVGSGLFGYLSYDLKDYIEKLPKTSIDDLDLPCIYLCSPSIILIHDKDDKVNWICRPEGPFSDSLSMKDAIRQLTSKKGAETNHINDHNGSCHSFSSNFTQQHYEDAIKKIREYIAAGHVYQVNMSQRFEVNFNGDPFSLFKRFYLKNPAPFFAYINAGDHHIISTSPERFLKQRGRQVETRPIKGTRPRGKTETEDKALRHELESSKKDDAELSMIVDLMRNDLGKVCEASSVKVVEHKRIEAYENVYHMVSIVEGMLERKHDSTDLIKATFPGGSITGCPKIRAMEIIDELEPNRRHVYTGAIGYISFHDTMDLSIAIRVATLYNDKIFFSVGGGVVYDSDPLDEYNETLHKGKTLMDTLKENKAEDIKSGLAWINGSIRPLEQSGVNITDLGLQYGYGFFETIRVDFGIPRFLEDHIERFNRTWRSLFGHSPPDLSWEEIINQVIQENSFENNTVALKIMATWGGRSVPPYNHTICVLARPYINRLTDKKENGLRLGIYPNPRYSPLADHKTLNYLYYYMAGKWAVDNGYDEAVILNPDGSLSETNTANILLIKDKTVIQPASPHVLPGVMEKNVCELLKESDYVIKREKVMPEDLFKFDNVIITNSLMGALPALSFDGNDLKVSDSLIDVLKKTDMEYNG